MKQKNRKTLTIFLCVMIAILFTTAIVFTLVKNHLDREREYYDNQNQIIEEQLKR